MNAALSVVRRILPLALAFVCGPFVMVAVAASGDWPAWRYDGGRTAASPHELPAELRLQWKRELPEPRPAFPHDPRLCFDRSYEPVAAGNRILLPSMVTDSLTALDSDTGEERWTFFADAPVRFAPLASAGRVYFVSDDGCLYCLSIAEGRLLWKFSGLSADRAPYKLLGNERLISRWPARGGPVLADGTIYFAAGLWPSEGVFVYAVDAETGRQVWASKDAGFVPDGLLDHGTRRDGGLAPQGYLMVLGSKLIVPCGRALPAVFDRKTGQMEPYTTGWGGRIALAKGCWYACGIGNYLFQSGDVYELTSRPAEASTPDKPDLKVPLADFALHLGTSVATAAGWVKGFGLDSGEEGNCPFVRVRSGGPVTYLSWWTSGKGQPLRPGEQQALQSRVRLEVDPANQKELRTFREPVLTGDRVYYSRPEISFSQQIKGEDRKPPSSAAYTEMVACDLTPSPKWSATYQGGWGSPYRLVQWPVANLASAWRFPSELKIHIKAGPRLYAGAEGAVAAIELPTAGGQPRAAWQAEIQGTPTRMLAANGKLLVVTAEGTLYCFGAAELAPKTWACEHPPLEAAADTWSGRVETIVRDTAAPEGYCLALGLGSGRLVDELLRQTKLHVIVVEGDAQRVATARARFHAMGLYGTRVHILPGQLRSLRLPPFFASLIVSENATDFDPQADSVARLFAALRPYGGAACLPVAADRHAAFVQMVKAAKLAGAKTSRLADLTCLKREGPLADAGQWTHEGGDAARTFTSQDRAARPPFGVLWFGGQLDRAVACFSGPVPRVAAGRMFCLVGQDLHAIDIYTGRHLWKRDLPRSGPLVATETDLYALSAGACHRIDPATGDTRQTIPVPPSLGVRKAAWKEIGITGSRLVGTIGKHLVCLDPKNGRLQWSAPIHRDELSFALGGDKVYCIDYWLPIHRRRGEQKSEEGAISALDANTGRVLWEVSASTPAVTPPAKKPDLPILVNPQLAYAASSDVLVFTRNQSTAAAYQGATGKLLWAKEFPCKDPPNSFTAASPPIVLADRLVTHGGQVVDLRTGEPGTRMWKGMNGQLRGCGRALGSPCLITVRDAHLSCFDLADGQHRYIRGIRGGCTNSLIPAGGILNAPNYGRSCTCNYPVSTSLALFHLPEAAGWDAAPP